MSADPLMAAVCCGSHPSPGRLPGHRLVVRHFDHILPFRLSSTDPRRQFSVDLRLSRNPDFLESAFSNILVFCPTDHPGLDCCLLYTYMPERSITTCLLQPYRQRFTTPAQEGRQRCRHAKSSTCCVILVARIAAVIRLILLEMRRYSSSRAPREDGPRRPRKEPAAFPTKQMFVLGTCGSTRM